MPQNGFRSRQLGSTVQVAGLNSAAQQFVTLGPAARLHACTANQAADLYTWPVAARDAEFGASRAGAGCAQESAGVRCLSQLPWRDVLPDHQKTEGHPVGRRSNFLTTAVVLDARMETLVSSAARDAARAAAEAMLTAGPAGLDSSTAHVRGLGAQGRLSGHLRAAMPADGAGVHAMRLAAEAKEEMAWRRAQTRAASHLSAPVAGVPRSTAERARSERRSVGEALGGAVEAARLASTADFHGAVERMARDADAK